MSALTRPPALSTMTAEEIAVELAEYASKHGFRRPARSTIDPDRPWLHGRPDYDAADLLFFRGRSKKHAAGSREAEVEDAVKTWEMEASHLPFEAWATVDHAAYRVCANGGRAFAGAAGAEAGNYNWLLAGVERGLYDAEKETFESSHALFRGTFRGGFPWEVLNVFAGPPRIAFSWRHWGTFDGEFRGRQGDGEVYDLFGWALVEVDGELKIRSVDIFYKPEPFLQALQGDLPAHALRAGKTVLGDGCPFLAARGAAAK